MVAGVEVLGTVVVAVVDAEAEAEAETAVVEEVEGAAKHHWRTSCREVTAAIGSIERVLSSGTQYIPNST